MAETAKEEVKCPNILNILAEDLGYSDLGCYGGEILTSNQSLILIPELT